MPAASRRFARNAARFLTPEQAARLDVRHADALLPDSLPAGHFDVVYAWGSLHHTGDLWTAVANVAPLCAPGGQFVLAIYNRTWFTRQWLAIKQTYHAMPGPVRVAMVAALSAPRYLARALRGRHPFRVERGMSVWYDSIDWLGGLPYEAATVDEVTVALARMGYRAECVRPTRRHGCNEFVFRRQRGSRGELSVMTHLPGGWVALCAHATAIAGVAWVILRWCRAIAAVDARLGIIVGLGILLRLALGVALFWISYFDWSPLAGLHSGDGFWELAPDARYYFLAAADAATDRLSLVEPGGPSPTFVVTLALWMRLVGATPAAAVLMNALLAAAACRLVVSVLHEAREPLAKRAMLVIVTGVSLSPALVLFAAQGLKDQFIVSLLVLAAAGLLWWLEARQTMPVHRLKNAGAWLSVAIAVFCIAGVRVYPRVFHARRHWRRAAGPGPASAHRLATSCRRRTGVDAGVVARLYGGCRSLLPAVRRHGGQGRARVCDGTLARAG